MKNNKPTKRKLTAKELDDRSYLMWIEDTHMRFYTSTQQLVEFCRNEFAKRASLNSQQRAEIYRLCKQTLQFGH